MTLEEIRQTDKVGLKGALEDYFNECRKDSMTPVEHQSITRALLERARDIGFDIWEIEDAEIDALLDENHWWLCEVDGWDREET
jgi:hypothetical protein